MRFRISDQKWRKDLMSWAWLLVVLAAIPIYFVTFLFFELSALGRVANSFLQAARRKDIGKANKYLSEQNRAPSNKRALEAFMARSSIRGSRRPSGGPGRSSTGPAIC